MCSRPWKNKTMKQKAVGRRHFRCLERAMRGERNCILHLQACYMNRHEGKLLMALVCEYMEWCELEHRPKVYMPELNQPRIYSRTNLEDILGLVGEPKADSPEPRPLLLSIVESFLIDEKETSGTGPAGQAKHSRQGAAG